LLTRRPLTHAVRDWIMTWNDIPKPYMGQDRRRSLTTSPTPVEKSPRTPALVRQARRTDNAAASRCSEGAHVAIACFVVVLVIFGVVPGTTPRESGFHGRGCEEMI
jgi:hypothetical protein